MNRSAHRVAILFALLAWLLPGLSAQSADTRSAFEAAVEDYRAQRYAEAAARFSDLADGEADRARRAVLRANAGTAAARAERLGEAAWQLRQALLDNPGDAVAEANVARVLELLGHGGGEHASLAAAVKQWPLRLSRPRGEVLGTALIGVALLGLAAWRLYGLRRGVAGASLAVLIAGGGWLLLTHSAWEAVPHRAVILHDAVAARSEPDLQGDVLFRLPEGELVQHDDERRGWRLIQSAAGARGWVPAESARPLQP